MSRMRFLFALFLLACPASYGRAAVDRVDGVGAAPAKAQKLRLSFHYPCTFVYEDGKPYEERVMDFQCDYMHASIKNADESFNALPTPEAQKAFLRSASRDADAAHIVYIKDIAALIKETDPATIPKGLTRVGRMERLESFVQYVSTKSLEISGPFLWPPRQMETYLEKTSGPWPSSWSPYLQPIYAHVAGLVALIRAEQKAMIDKTSAELDKKMLRISGQDVSEVTNRTGVDVAALEKLFDGSRARGVVVEAGGGAKRARAGGGAARSSVPVASDLQVAQPPDIPHSEAERSQRNYFARGVRAGLQRLKDDAAVAIRREAGETRTRGNPYGRASLIILQKGPSCSVAAQYEALRARRKEVEIEPLVKEGHDKGYYASAAAGMRSSS